MPAITTLRPSAVGRLNERQVLRMIQARGPLSRADVARGTGLSAPTVSKAVAALVGAGLLEEADAPEAARGRPAPRLRLNTTSALVIGIAVDAGHCEVVSAGLDGVLHPEVVTVPTWDTYGGLITALAEAARPLTKKPGVTALGVGVSLPGLVDDRAGRGVLSPNVPVTDGHAPAADLAQRLGVPAVLVQESHALCLAERDYGRAKGVDDFAVLDVGAGVGLGVMCGGRLLTGHSGLAGELGHLTAVADGGFPCGCGNRGCLETVASDAGLARRLVRRLGRPVDVDGVVEVVRAGGPAVEAELAETTKYLGVAVAAVVNLFNPATVFVHSRLFGAVPGLFAAVEAEARTRALKPSAADCRLLPASGSKRQGAVAGAIQHLTNAVAAGHG